MPAIVTSYFWHFLPLQQQQQQLPQQKAKKQVQKDSDDSESGKDKVRKYSHVS